MADKITNVTMPNYGQEYRNLLATAKLANDTALDDLRKDDKEVFLKLGDQVTLRADFGKTKENEILITKHAWYNDPKNPDIEVKEEFTDYVSDGQNVLINHDVIDRTGPHDTKKTREMMLLNLSTGTLTQLNEPAAAEPQPSTGAGYEKKWFAPSPDSKTMYMTTPDGTITARDSHSNKELWSFMRESQRGSPDPRFYMVPDNDGKPRLFCNTSRGIAAIDADGHMGVMYSTGKNFNDFSISNDGKTLIYRPVEGSGDITLALETLKPL